MTKKRYDALSGRKVLCKMVPYRNDAVGYKQTAGLDLNVYNKCFILDVQREVLQVADPLRLSVSPEDDRQTLNIASMTPEMISDLDFDIVSDRDILKMNDLQLDRIPESRRRRLSKVSSKVSRNGLTCSLPTRKRTKSSRAQMQEPDLYHLERQEIRTANPRRRREMPTNER